MQVADSSFTYIEVMGLEHTNEIKTYLGHIFNEEQSRIVGHQIGKNLNHLKLFTEFLLDTENPDLKKHISCEAPEFEGEFAKFCYKVNSVYTRPEVQHLLEEGELDFAIYDVINKLSKLGGEVNLYDSRGDYIREASIIKALCETGVLYEEQHYTHLHFGSRMTIKMAARWARERYAEFSINDKIEYEMFRLRKGLDLSELKQNIEKEENSIYNSFRQYLYWDTDLYGQDYGRRPDPSGTDNPCVEQGSTQLKWVPYGLGAGNLLIRQLLSPFVVFVAYFYKYPYKYLGEAWDFASKGLGRFPIGYNALAYWGRRWNYKSELPQSGRENKQYLTTIQNNRAILKAVYMAEHPELYNKGDIKWRHVRRFIRDSKKSIMKYG
mmetsp:Transcript_26656/g.47971  ORF Transcript_26656/g.47971 Transcript_26656/m.47971 type:complete len:380 (+) Transcript_26656:1217-2356(+)